MEITYQYLHFASYSTIPNWSVQYLRDDNLLSSSFPMKMLGNYITEESQKYNISDPSCEYGILGVNNQTGIFDAYIENGAKIKQKYKKMKEGWIAYNPYRINVGSVGVKQAIHHNIYISPAYVVFSCKKELLPDFLYLIMRTPTFNQIIKRKTTGSVRQTLSYKNLQALKIPMPSLKEQNRLVSNYHRIINKSLEMLASVDEANEVWKQHIYQQLFETSKKDKKSNGTFLHYINYKDIVEWGIQMIRKRAEGKCLSKYKALKTKQLCLVNSGGTPSRSNKEYYQGNIPWIKTGEVLNNLIYDTEEHITNAAILNSSAKIYPKGSLIIAMYGQGDTRGRSAKLGVDAATNQACAVLHHINEDLILTDYLWIYLQVMYDDLRSLASGTNQPNLNADKIKNYEIIVPPKEIQEEIVTYAKSKQEEIHNLNLQAQTLRDQALQEFEKELFKQGCVIGESQ